MFQSPPNSPLAVLTPAHRSLLAPGKTHQIRYIKTFSTLLFVLLQLLMELQPVHAACQLYGEMDYKHLVSTSCLHLQCVNSNDRQL